MWIDMGAVRISHTSMVLLLGILAMILLMLMDSLVWPTWMLVPITGAYYTATSFLPCLFRMSSILARSHPRVWADNLPLHTKQRLIDLDKLVYQIVESLLIVDVGSSLNLELPRIAFKILREHLFQVLVEFLCILVFREVLLVILNKLLDLFLELLI